MRGLATTPGTLRRAAWVTSRLKDRVLAAAFDQELQSFEHRAMVVRRAAPFRDDGFPVPLVPPGTARRGRKRSPVPLAVVGIAGTGLVAVLVVVAVALSGQHSTGSGALPTRMSLSQPSAASPGTAPSADAGSGEPRPQRERVRQPEGLSLIRRDAVRQFLADREAIELDRRAEAHESPPRPGRRSARRRPASHWPGTRNMASTAARSR